MTVEGITLDELKAARPDLVVELQREGAKAEHERLQHLLKQPRSVAALLDRAFDLANGKLANDC